VPRAGSYQWPFYLIIDQQMEHDWLGMITNPEELPIGMTVGSINKNNPRTGSYLVTKNKYGKPLSFLLALKKSAAKLFFFFLLLKKPSANIYKYS
jgi:hypothetical protein